VVIAKFHCEKYILVNAAFAKIPFPGMDHNLLWMQITVFSVCPIDLVACLVLRVSARETCGLSTEQANTIKNRVS
jgi:hypothetical protein